MQVSRVVLGLASSWVILTQQTWAGSSLPVDQQRNLPKSSVLVSKTVCYCLQAQNACLSRSISTPNTQRDIPNDVTSCVFKEPPVEVGEDLRCKADVGIVHPYHICSKNFH